MPKNPPDDDLLEKLSKIENDHRDWPSPKEPLRISCGYDAIGKVDWELSLNATCCLNDLAYIGHLDPQRLHKILEQLLQQFVESVSLAVLSNNPLAYLELVASVTTDLKDGVGVSVRQGMAEFEKSLKKRH